MIEISPDFHIVQATTEEQFQQCMTVRMKVFVEEQGYDAKIEQDEYDAESAHFLLVHTPTALPIGNVRYYSPRHKLGRLAVLPSFRKHKLGAHLVDCVRDHAIQQAKEKGEKEAVVMCHSQAYVVGFYQKLGYVPVGPRFQEEDTEHQKMVLTVQF